MNVLLNTAIRARIGTTLSEIQPPVSVTKRPESRSEPSSNEYDANIVQTSRRLSDRRISRHTRKPLGDPTTHLKELTHKPILTQRDKEVLLSIYKHRCLTTDQITEIHFRYSLGKTNNQAAVVARRRLRKMYDYHLIDRFFVDVGERRGSSPAHVMLDQLGARVVAGLLNCQVNELHWRPETNEQRLPYLKHIVGINDFYLHLLKAARTAGHDLGEFHTENLTRHEFNYWGSKFVVNPDAYGQYFTGSEGFHFFLEWDRDTMSVPTFQKKQQRYAAFYASDEYKKFYDTFPIILTVAPSWERAIKLRDCIYSIDDTDILWLFTSAEQMAVNPLAGWIGKEGLRKHHLLETE